MSNVARVTWTITPGTVPQPWIGCSRCGGSRPFRCSGKFRLNASGKQLDAWLIYKCRDCDNTWNFPVLERRNRRDVEASFLDALATNDPVWVKRFAFDTVALGRKAGHLEEFDDIVVEKHSIQEPTQAVSHLEILVTANVHTGVRGDRLIASELGLSRQRIRDFQESGRLSVADGQRRAFHKPLMDGVRILLDLNGEIDAVRILAAATGREI